MWPQMSTAFSCPALLSNDPRAGAIRENCDYSQRWTLEELRSGVRPTRPIRIIADGVFDLFHVGHANLFRQIKTELLPPWCEVYTIARTCSDEDAAQLKVRPVQKEHERREMLRHCRYVDEVIFELNWSTTPEICQKHKVDFLAHDAAPYQAGSDTDNDLYGWAKKANMFLETKRTEGVSSTLLREMIKNRTNNYIAVF